MEEHTSEGSPSGRATWRSPSNIAIVKYWGKYGEQQPTNPSISLTLSSAATTTSVDYGPGNGNIEFFFEGKKVESFAGRVNGYVKRITKELPQLGGLDLVINSENSFPHSAGIASSASAMSALALCLMSAAGCDRNDPDFVDTASDYARLGSGSAARSVAGPVMLWGDSVHLEGSSQDKAIVVPEVHDVFRTYRDTILLVSKAEKEVKSSAGHSLMNNHPYAQQRFERAGKHIGELLDVLRSGDVQRFGQLAEQEALDLHAMMMTSTPPYLLIRPNTVAIIELLRAFRADTGIPAYMTLDAGPNVHLLYPAEHSDAVQNWLDSEITQLCEDGKMIHDQVGMGAECLED